MHTKGRLLYQVEILYNYAPFQIGTSWGAQRKSAWLETEGPPVRASPASLRCGPWARHIYPSLVLVQPRKPRPCLTERLLMGCKESNQTNKTKLELFFPLRAVPCGMENTFYHIRWPPLNVNFLSPKEVGGIYSRGTKVAYRAKTHIFCTRKVYGWIFVYW